MIQFGDSSSPAQEAGCELLLNQPKKGDHFEDETKGNYKTNPPDLGGPLLQRRSRVGGRRRRRLPNTAPPESRLVHAMEHGRVEIRYAPDLPEDQQLALKGVFDESPGGMIMVPDPDLHLRGRGQRLGGCVGCKTSGPLVLDVRNFRDTFGATARRIPSLSG